MADKRVAHPFDSHYLPSTRTSFLRLVQPSVVLAQDKSVVLTQDRLLSFIFLLFPF